MGFVHLHLFFLFLSLELTSGLPREGFIPQPSPKPEYDDWILIYPIENEIGFKEWYYLSVKERTVFQEHIGSMNEILNNFEFDFKQFEVIYIPDFPCEFDLSFIESSKLKHCKKDIDLSFQSLIKIPKKYKTHEKNNWHQPAFIGMVCLCLTGLGAWMMMNDEVKKVPLTEPDKPLETWYRYLETTPLSDQAFKYSSKILSETFLLPDSWVPAKLTLVDQEISVSITPQNSAPSYGPLNQWYSNIGKKMDVSFNVEDRTLTSHVNLIETNAAVLGRYPQKLYEQLRLIGIDELDLKQLPNEGSTESWSLTGTMKKANLSTLLNIAYLTKEKPSFASSLTIVPNGNRQFDLAFTLTLIGIIND